MVYSLFHRRHDDDAIPVLTEIIETPEAGTPAADGSAPGGVADAGAIPAAGMDAPAALQIAAPEDGAASEAPTHATAEAEATAETQPEAEAGLPASRGADSPLDAPAPVALAEPGDYDPDDLPVMTEPIASPLMAFAPRPAFGASREALGASATHAVPAPEPDAAVTDRPADAARSDELLPPLDIAGGEAAFASLLTPHIRPLPTALTDLGARAAGANEPATADAPRPTEADIRARAEASLRAEADELAVRLRDDLLARLRPRLGDLLDQRIAEAVGDVLAAELPRLHARIEAALVSAVGDLVAHAVADELDRLDKPAPPDA
ncbi:hypothetical protein [Derxia gummosa]|uniref:Uncharacterized protein n=1 Tax=Derxia gummosa DSM 723 TaxID=1121388 RepID=A0A8B6X6S4_9BURK|nr:hypothetical protein [Derxia gummosa]